ncbi:hypothetical protein C3432_11170 [Citrobacter amalonaticus]|uniref:Uncharacterized protein n=1 Tax=Citrobacter amalonaticus TaxID=35703 RepID=A0A2S4S0J6_CITAM|nr:hypothetical protein C3432_11170 [Citrobacter amalonaticus]POT76031.1 hypothetical protein C3436_00650 [Citrobacter amalonaticus]POU66970.1 hypothetical protein C3430_09370 [Citrobacter amalonaticus]POV05265.1 hypothetical protein C3424_07955 [Citrobacter amalonaticus]
MRQIYDRFMKMIADVNLRLLIYDTTETRYYSSGRGIYTKVFRSNASGMRSAASTEATCRMKRIPVIFQVAGALALLPGPSCGAAASSVQICSRQICPATRII